MLRVSWDIDTLGISIRQTESSSIASQSCTLNTQSMDGEVRWRVMMSLPTNLGADEELVPDGRASYCNTPGYAGSILIPPHAQSRHIMAGNGTDRTVWITAQMTELNRWILWHALEFQAQIFNSFITHGTQSGTIPRSSAQTSIRVA